MHSLIKKKKKATHYVSWIVFSPRKQQKVKAWTEHRLKNKTHKSYKENKTNPLKNPPKSCKKHGQNT